MTNQDGGYRLLDFTAEYYDVTYNRRNDTDVPFFVDYSRRAKGRTLELACGTGRVLIPTAQAGCEITGLDLSSHMLAKCREKVAQLPEGVRKRIKLAEGNMTDFSLGEKFALVTLPFRPFQHLITVKDQKACLNCIYQHLKAQGQVIIDLFNPNPVYLMPKPVTTEEKEDMPETLMPDGRKIRRANRFAGYHKEQQYNDVELIYYVTHTDGRKERLVDSFPFRYFFRYEMEHLLELCGFKVIDLFGNFDKSALTSDSPEMIFIAGKK